ncbi:phytophthora infestans avirulence-associated protein 3.4F-A [Achlya hypogyna]|uniref:Phytophthora infestans avirulence-associated protein 3.4F-A n=1 Tax=Achlya hypogyna TaxID=1202772 RepID=A0A1V9ZU71_ACHHY|nr:phytophthora infestans avirulence-associated protein 3.4F-A [Achlya hypogyna]
MEAAIAEDFCYGPEDLVRPQVHGDMPRDLAAFVAMRGFDTRKRNNLLYLDDDKLLTCAGNTAQIIDITTIKRTYVFGYSGTGVGAIAVHPNRGFFAVGEKGPKPNICIYIYPSLKLYRVLRNGTERAYCSLRFSNDGTKLASVGGAPDFLLTVWNWRLEQTILRCKAFGQEVFNVQFAPHDNGFLTTSGTGHVRFWKMASTFTGLKLQGDIGKFGKSELSDIEAFCVLPDKKVLSSTERGALLLWDGNFIKCEIVSTNRERAHKGPINVILFEPDLRRIVTAGSDGTIKWWPFADIDQADVKEDDTVAVVTPIDAVSVTTKTLHHAATPADIRCLLRGSDHYLVQDGHGQLHRFDTQTKLVTTLLECHAGPVTGVGTSPVEHTAATCGADGAVTCWDYITATPLFSTHFNTGATALTYAPVGHDPTGRTVAVAFADGVVRVLERGPTSWHRAVVFKPHHQPVVCMAYSPDGAYFCSASADNTVSAGLMAVVSLHKFDPVGFKAGIGVRHLSWRLDSKALLLTCYDGVVGEMLVPAIGDDDRPTYELDIDLKTFTFRRARKLSSTELAAMATEPVTDKPAGYNLLPCPPSSSVGFGEVDIAPDTPPLAVAAMYCCTSPSCFLVTVAGAHAGGLYKCDWGRTYPLEAYPDDPAGLVHTLTRSHSQQFVVAGNANGKVHVRAALAPFASLTLAMHDQATHGTAAVAMSFDDSFVVSGGSDGQLVTVRVMPEKMLATATALMERHAMRLTEAKKVYQKVHDQVAAKNEVRGEGSEGANLWANNPVYAGAVAFMQIVDALVITDIEVFGGVPRLLADEPEDAFPAVAAVDLSREAPVTRKEVPDITNPDAYTIQDAKLKLEADIRANSALAKKNRTRAIIAEMQEEFRQLQLLDSSHEPTARLEPHHWNIDPEYGAMLMTAGDRQCDEVRKEMAFAFEQSELLQAKMRRKYVGGLAVELITLHGFANGLHVQSFRTTRMAEALQDRLRLIHLELQEAASTQPSQRDERTVLDFIHTPKAATDDGKARPLEEAPETGGDDAASSHRFEYRKMMRAQRKARIQAWERKKPREDADDPRDVAAIAFASTHMEDYKLKTSASYVVPEDQRVNATKKRGQMALLEEKMYDVAMGFNAKVLELRELKHRLMEQIQEDNALLHALEASQKHAPATRRRLTIAPALDLREWPEQRERVLDAHVAEYQKKGTVGKATLAALEPPPPPEPAHGVHPLLALRPVEPTEHYVLSSLEEGDARIHATQVQMQIAALKRKVVHAVATFDDAIYRLRREKMKLDIALKKGEIKLMTRLGELVLLEQFESKETLLVSKLEKCKADKAQIVRDLTECNDQLLQKRKELEEWQASEAAIQTDFVALVGSLHPSFAVLQKLFRKRLKRAKKRAADDAGDDDDDEEESDDDYNSDDDDDDDGNEDETCPPGCDLALYEKVLALREKKADIDDATADKQRQIDKELAATEADIQAFQTEKQMRFNELDVVVALSKQQLRCLQPALAPEGVNPELVQLVLPETIENGLIFTKSAIQRLLARIRSLQDENKALRQVFKDLHKQQSQLSRDKARQRDVIAAVRDKCEQLQLLKFGQLIDIELLDKACDTGNLNDLKSKVRTKELQGEKHASATKTEQQQLKLEILRATEDNTRLLTEIAALSERQFGLEAELNAADVQHSLVDDSASLEQEMGERKKLVELVKLQARELDALKQEVLMLRGKKGRVHAPT